MNLNQTEVTDLDLGLYYQGIFQNATESPVWPNVTRKSRRNSPYSTGSVDSYYWRVGLFGVGGSVICCFGIVCNIIAIIVLWRLRNKSSAPCLLMCLAGLDCIYLLSFLFLENLTILSSGRLITQDYRKFITPIYGYLYPVPLICQTCTAYVVATITFERFVVIALPFRAHVLCSFKWAIISVVSLICLSILYHIPDYLAYQHVKIWNQQIQAYVHGIRRTDFGKGYFYTDIYWTWIQLTINFLVPFALIVVFNFMTLVSIYKSFMVKNHEVRQTQQRRLTIMIFTMTGVFFLCELMAAITFIITTELGGYHFTTIHVNRLWALSDTLMLFKSAVNFLIYCATGSKFREQFRELFCSYRRRPNASSSYTRRYRHTSESVSTKPGRLRLLNSLSCSSGTRTSASLSVNSQNHITGFSHAAASSSNKAERTHSNESGVAEDESQRRSKRLDSNGSDRRQKARLSLNAHFIEPDDVSFRQTQGAVDQQLDCLLEFRPIVRGNGMGQNTTDECNSTERMRGDAERQRIFDDNPNNNCCTKIIKQQAPSEDTQVSQRLSQHFDEDLENSCLLPNRGLNLENFTKSHVLLVKSKRKN